MSGVTYPGSYTHKQGWIGLHRPGAGSFTWFAGGGKLNSTTYSNWEGGKPDNQGCVEGCVAMNANNGTWETVACSKEATCTCQIVSTSRGVRMLVASRVCTPLCSD